MWGAATADQGVQLQGGTEPEARAVGSTDPRPNSSMATHAGQATSTTPEAECEVEVPWWAQTAPELTEEEETEQDVAPSFPQLLFEARFPGASADERWRVREEAAQAVATAATTRLVALAERVRAREAAARARLEEAGNVSDPAPGC